MENLSIEELQAEIRELGAAKSHAQELLDAKLIQRGITPDGTEVAPPRIYALRVVSGLRLEDGRVYIEGDVIEPRPLEALTLLKEFPEHFEDSNNG